jgi:hypothetical protein
MNYTVKYTYEGVDYNKWDKTFRKRLGRTLKRAGRRLANYGPLSMKAFITKASAHYSGNSIFYKRSKNGRAVLYNTGFLRSAPQYQTHSYTQGEDFGAVTVGIIDDVVHPSGTSLKKIIGSITKGGEWEPTSKQRKAYWAKMRKAGVDTKDAKYQKTYKQPKRNFIEDYAEKVDVTPILEKSVIEALHGTLRATKTKVIVGG